MKSNTFVISIDFKQPWDLIFIIIKFIYFITFIVDLQIKRPHSSHTVLIISSSRQTSTQNGYSGHSLSQRTIQKYERWSHLIKLEQILLQEQPWLIIRHLIKLGTMLLVILQWQLFKVKLQRENCMFLFHRCSSSEKKSVILMIHTTLMHFYMSLLDTFFKCYFLSGYIQSWISPVSFF